MNINSAENQLNALIRLKSFLDLKEKEVLVNSFVCSNFNCCPLVWMLSHKKSLDKIKSLHKRVLRFFLNDYVSSYEQLLEKSGKCNMNIRRLRCLCIELYKTLNDLNLSFMKEIFEKRDENRVIRDRYKLNWNTPRRKQVTFGVKSLKFYGPKI